ncbi:MAG TPA: DUF6600 domain-containing protein [Vicinamibacterales bacterium]|jgi:hypothetical protein|nr:DUF6600 domain-containing protein [Vicinamibacterales bacterium]
MTPTSRVRPFLVRCALSSVAAAACVLLPAALSAQAGDDNPPMAAASDFDPGPDAPDIDWSGDIPAHVDDIQGAVALERDGEALHSITGTPLLSGDRLRTDAGRAEVVFADGSVLDVDERSAVDFLDDGLLRLEAGRVRLSLAGRGGDEQYRIDGAGMTAWIQTAGDYRVSLAGAPGSQELTVSAIRGVAELQSPLGRTRVRSGYATVSAVRDAPSLPYPDNASAGDPFDLWVLAERDTRTNVATASYLPDDLRPYAGTLATDGAWEYLQPYGYVWYPRVAVGWAPYTYGEWSVVASFGWTWTGGPRWIWPTHHYGRWGFRASRWYWIPDRRWAPAWVSWANAPGYVGWCPLGWDNRPVVSITRVVARTGGWRAWTVVPSRAFSRGGYSRVSVRAAVHGPLGVSASAFTVRRASPIPAAVSRTTRPVRGPAYAASRTPRSIEVAPPVRPGEVNSGVPRSRSRIETTRRSPAVTPRADTRNVWSSPARASAGNVSRGRVAPASPSASPRAYRRGVSPTPPTPRPEMSQPTRMPSRGYRAPSTVRPVSPPVPSRMAPSHPMTRPAPEPRTPNRASSRATRGGDSHAGSRTTSSGGGHAHSRAR